jgi:outer membrane protein assembly factor BamA
MNVYASLTDPARVVASLHIGAGRILSDKYEYFQALTLGANNYLRGFRKDRFSGSALLSGSIELRIKLVDINSYVLPGAFGIVAFNDVGRVWARGESSHKWHDSYGGGLYFTPYNKILLSATAALSSEETIFNFTLGTKINLTY